MTVGEFRVTVGEFRVTVGEFRVDGMEVAGDMKVGPRHSWEGRNPAFLDRDDAVLRLGFLDSRFRGNDGLGAGFSPPTPSATLRAGLSVARILDSSLRSE